ncbi:MAG: DUF1926 domain-containing protein [Treponema sp.]|jgi:hypothetical protein|nr:DUF1926 domain-containing protein [Treponema sp.]
MADTKISLVLGSHAHVPYGADVAEFENAYANLLKPFVSSLYKFPKIQAALHYSGVLLHWVERSHPELLMLLEDMVNRKQVEILGGGFYEPMLPIISSQDKIGQIEFFTTYLRKHFGKRPQGCWIPGFAWEQCLVSPLVSCGMGFTFLSEWQFALAGGGRAPCICEDNGKFIVVFPVLQSLAEALAKKNIASLLENPRGDIGDNAVVSIFPEKANARTNESPEVSWSHFFEEISLCENFAETVTPGKLLKNLKGLQKLYFPDSTSCKDGKPARRFIIENPEANRIYSKMIFTNVLINQLRGDKSRKLSAHEELWKAQGYNLFCTTGKQGLHNQLLRNTAYSALLGAERVTKEKGKFAPSLVSFDFNMDGEGEWLFQDSRINCYVQSMGGGIFELDYLPKAWNYLDTCQGRTAFADRLLPAGVTAENLKAGAMSGARLCCNERYEPGDMDKVRRKLRLTLKPQSTSPFGCVEIEKTFQTKKDSVCVGYFLVNQGVETEAFQFAPEIDLALPGETDADTRFFACKAETADTPLSEPLADLADGIKIHDLKNEVQITLAANRPFGGRILPLNVRDSTGEELFQAFCIMPIFPVSLNPGESWGIELVLKFSH